MAGGWNIFGQLLRAQLELLSADPSPGVDGRVLFNTTTKKFRGDNGTQIVDLGGGGGGAGIPVIWMPDEAALSPAEMVENNQKIWLFSAGETQKIYAALPVPSSYSAGLPISLLIKAYSPSTANSFLLQAVSTLIRKDTDAVSSTTNQRTTTNAAQANGTANVLRQITLDITSTTGTINSVAVSAGDLILLQLSRAADSDTDDVRFLPLGSEATFS